MNESTDNNARNKSREVPAERELEALRAELDGIDDRLLDDVRARLEVCTRIAHLKRRHAIPVMQPRRMGTVHEHAHRYALEHDLSPQFLHNLYDLLISETCRVEDVIVATEPPPTSDVAVEHADSDGALGERSVTGGAINTSAG